MIGKGKLYLCRLNRITMSKDVRVRFAPSPTGPLHIGGVRTALYNYLFAKGNNGTFILRVEDTDQTRFVEGAEDYIRESLEWLGLTYDEGPEVGGEFAPYRQSERRQNYSRYAERMVDEGNAYYAFDSEEDLNNMRDRLKANNMSPKYDAASRMSMVNSLTLSEDDLQKKLDAGEPYVIRIKLPRKEEVRFHDEIRGWVSVHTNQMDDKVLLKADGMPTYHLANVVDDYTMKISHVIRGEEWLPSAPLHVMLYRYLGWKDSMPKFAHLPLILKPDGNGKLSKRDGDRLGFPVFPLQWTDPKTKEKSTGYRESNYIPAAVVNMLALLGWHPSDHQEMFTLEELVSEFSLERVSKSGAKFDQDKAKWFNQQYLKLADNDILASQLMPFIEEKGWRVQPEYLVKVVNLLKEKVTFSKEILEEGNYFFTEPTSYDEKTVRKKWKDNVPQLMKELADRFSFQSQWNEAEIEKTLAKFAESKGMGTGKLMQPLRLAVSGKAGGPPIYEVLELLGQDKVVNRLNAAEREIEVV